MNIFIFTPALPPNMMSVWRSSARSLLQTPHLSMTKLILYKMLILPVLLYGAEVWILLSTEAAVLRVLERERRYSVRFELAMISAPNLTISCMRSSTTQTLCSAMSCSNGEESSCKTGI